MVRPPPPLMTPAKLSVPLVIVSVLEPSSTKPAVPSIAPAVIAFGVLNGPEVPEKLRTPPELVTNTAVPPLLMVLNVVVPPVLVMIVALPAVASALNASAPPEFVVMVAEPAVGWPLKFVEPPRLLVRLAVPALGVSGPPAVGPNVVVPPVLVTIVALPAVAPLANVKLPPVVPSPTLITGAKAELLCMPSVVRNSEPPELIVKVNGAVALEVRRIVLALAAELIATCVVPEVLPKVATVVAATAPPCTGTAPPAQFVAVLHRLPLAAVVPVHAVPAVNPTCRLL